MLTAILAILGGKSPEIPERNPYAPDIEQIQAGIEAGGLPDSGEDDSTDAEAMQHAQQVAEALIAFMNADGVDAIQQIVEDNQAILLSDAVDPAFSAFMQQAQQSGNQGLVQTLAAAQMMLRECRTNGIDATFRRLREAMEQNTDNDEEGE